MTKRRLMSVRTWRAPPRKTGEGSARSADRNLSGKSASKLKAAEIRNIVAKPKPYELGLKRKRDTKNAKRFFARIKLPKMDYAARPGAKGTYSESIILLRG